MRNTYGNTNSGSKKLGRFKNLTSASIECNHNSNCDFIENIDCDDGSYILFNGPTPTNGDVHWTDSSCVWVKTIHIFS